MSLYHYKVIIQSSDTKLFVSSNKQELMKSRKKQMSAWGNSSKAKVTKVKKSRGNMAEFESPSSIY